VTLTTLTMSRAHDEAMGDEPSMPDRPRRRSFTADYKLAILDEYDRCTGDGDKGGAVAPRRPVHEPHSRVATRPGLRWARRPRQERAASEEQPARRELARTKKRAERAEAELAKTRLVVEIQGKASELLGRLLAESDEENRQQR